MSRDPRTIAYALLRLSLGVNIFGHGFFRILSGTGAFAHGMASGMDKGPLPHGFVLAFGYCIPWIECAIGTLLVLGLWTRFALIAGALFMVALTFGTTSIQNWNAAGTQLIYSFVFFAMLWAVEANHLSADGILSARQGSDTV